MFLDIVKLGVRFLPEKPEGRFYVAKNRLYSHHLSFLCDKPGKQLPCLHEQIFAGQVQRAAKQRAVRYRSNREAEPKRLDKPGKQLPCLHEQIFAGQVQRAAKQRAVRYRSNREAEPKRLDKPGKYSERRSSKLCVLQ